MRPFLLTAAIAASIVTASLTFGPVANAAGLGSHAERDRVERRSGRDSQGDADVTPGFMAFSARPMAGFFTEQRPRLSRIVSELARAERRIQVDRRHGTLTSAEANAARDEDRAIRTTAIQIAAHNGGGLPESSYEMLQSRVAGLDEAIRREARA